MIFLRKTNYKYSMKKWADAILRCMEPGDQEFAFLGLGKITYGNTIDALSPKFRSQTAMVR